MIESKYSYDEESVKALVEWAQNTTFPQEIVLNEGEKIYDVKRFIEVTLIDIKEHYPIPTFNTSIKHLYELKEAMEKQ